MKYPIIVMALLTTFTSYADTASVTWKERGNTVSATAKVKVETSEDGVVTKRVISEKPTIKLATGQIATLTGGVYVKSTDTDAVLAWALENGHTATKDKYISDVVHVEATPAASISVANEVAKVEGVNTAAPNYSMPKVLK